MDTPGGYVDQHRQFGIAGLYNIVRTTYTHWKITEHGNLVKDLKMRGLDDVNALPGFYYRDDALLLWNAMDKYISSVVNQVYGV